MKRTDKILDVIAWIFLFVSIALLSTSGRILENIIHGNRFIIKFGLLGLIIAIIVLFVIYKTNKQYFQNETNARESAILSYFFGIIVVTFFLCGFYNNYTAKQNQAYSEIVVADKAENIRYRTGYIKLAFNGKIERFDVKMNVWNKIEKNDTIGIVVGKGNLGYQYIIQFNPRYKDNKQ